MYILPEVIVFWDANFDGESWATSFPVGWGYSYVGDHWNDQISSVIVRCGQWQFFSIPTWAAIARLSARAATRS